MQGRAYRRHTERVVKARARRLLMRRRWKGDAGEWITPRLVGYFAQTHCKPCSCLMCRNPGPDRPRQKRWIEETE